jgi:hypothetical protein
MNLCEPNELDPNLDPEGSTWIGIIKLRNLGYTQVFIHLKLNFHHWILSAIEPQNRDYQAFTG